MNTRRPGVTFRKSREHSVLKNFFLCFSAAKSSKSPRSPFLFSEKCQKTFFPAFRWRKAAKATRPIPMPASERLKAASGDCAGLQANRPRRSRFQPSVRSFAIGTKSGPAMREKRVPERMPYKLLYCRLRRHSNSALSFDAEKRGYDTRRVRHGVALRPDLARPVQRRGSHAPAENDVRRLLVLLAPKVQETHFFFCRFSPSKKQKKKNMGNCRFQRYAHRSKKPTPGAGKGRGTGRGAEQKKRTTFSSRPLW